MLDYETIYVNGQWEIVPDSKPLAVTDPATGEAVGSAPNCSGAVVDLAVAAARHAFPSWSNTDRAERRDLLVRLVTLLRDDAENLAQIIHREMGSTIEFSRSEQVGTPICIIEGYIDALTDDEPEEWIGNSLIVREPVGVVGAITPWNYPLYQLVTKVVPAMAAGCTVVAKPPEIAPLSSYRFAELLDEAGVPPGVFNLVNGLGSVVGEAIVRHPDVDMVSFTGSTRAGRRVGAVAAETIKRVSLELGGKSASIVLDGADLEQAVRATMGYCMANFWPGLQCLDQVARAGGRPRDRRGGTAGHRRGVQCCAGSPGFVGTVRTGPRFDSVRYRRRSPHCSGRSWTPTGTQRRAVCKAYSLRRCRAVHASRARGGVRAGARPPHLR